MGAVVIDATGTESGQRPCGGVRCTRWCSASSRSPWSAPASRRSPSSPGTPSPTPHGRSRSPPSTTSPPSTLLTPCPGPPSKRTRPTPTKPSPRRSPFPGGCPYFVQETRARGVDRRPRPADHRRRHRHRHPLLRGRGRRLLLPGPPRPGHRTATGPPAGHGPARGHPAEGLRHGRRHGTAVDRPRPARAEPSRSTWDCSTPPNTATPRSPSRTSTGSSSARSPPSAFPNSGAAGPAPEVHHPPANSHV